MPVCPSCYGFHEADDERCPSCGVDLTGQLELGAKLLEAAQQPADGEPPTNDGWRPTMLVLPIACIAPSFAVWHATFRVVRRDTEDSPGDLVLAAFLLAILGGVSLGGLILMLARQRRGYEDRHARAWWIAGLAPLALPALAMVADVMAEEHNPLAITVAALLLIILSMVGTAGITEDRREGRSGWPAAGSWLCLAWLLWPPAVVLIAWIAAA